MAGELAHATSPHRRRASEVLRELLGSVCGWLLGAGPVLLSSLNARLRLSSPEDGEAPIRSERPQPGSNSRPTSRHLRFREKCCAVWFD
ncbi:UNVERIFIED_CONTAM: hypothetical protein K2H54_017655 [Gekko kuhli]